MIQKKKQKQIY